MNAAEALAMETMALSKRWFLHTLRQPIVVAAGLFQPIIWLFLFGSLFRFIEFPAAQLTGTSYIPFLAAGVIVFTAFNSALAAGVPLLFDKENRFLDRLLAAPLASRFSIVAASAIHIFVMSTLQTALVLGVVTWWSPELSLTLPQTFAILAVTALLILGFTTVSIVLAFSLRAHFEMLSLIQVLGLPMIFISSAFAPLEIMPVWLQWLASLNPLTAAIEPVRHLMLHGGAPAGVLVSAPWGELGMRGCLAYLAGFNAVVVGATWVILHRFFR
jgi:ABC-2 type transport system permease protein